MKPEPMIRPLLVKITFATAILLIVGYAAFIMHGPQGIPGLRQRREEIRALEKQNQDLAREVEHKRERIQRLREDRSEQEMEIRQRLKLVRPGEKVFILQDQEQKPANP